jgi:hypothetical protein
VGLTKGVMVSLLASGVVDAIHYTFGQQSTTLDASKLTITPVIKPTSYHTGSKQGNHYTFGKTHNLPHWM